MAIITTNNPLGAGRDTILDEELLIKIRDLILDGKNLKEVAEICEIPKVTVYTWNSRNYLDFYNKVENWKRDRKLILAEKNIEEFLEMSDVNKRITKDGDIVVFKDTQLTKIKADTSKFVAETLGRKHYGKSLDLSSGGLTLADLLKNKYDDTREGSKKLEEKAD